MKLSNKPLVLLPACSIAVLLSAIGCNPDGGGGSASYTPSSSQSTTGAVTGFGSVIVNGVHFDTSSAAITINGEPAVLSDLAVGMIVDIGGDGKNESGEEDYEHGEDDDGIEDQEDNALSIDASSELKGEVLSVSITSGLGELSVMGQTVQISASTVFDSDEASIASIDNLAAGHIVEVSGFSDGNGEIFATRVELEALDFASFLAAHSEGVEVKGNITNLDLTEKTFDLGSISVNYSNAEIDSDDDGSDDGSDSGLSNDFYVEVESTEGIVNGVLIAASVEREDDGERGHQGSVNEHYDIEGIITSDYDGSHFSINGITVVVSNSTVFLNTDTAALTAGTEIEVEGVFDIAGNLQADTIELEEEADQQMTGVVSDIALNFGTVNVGSITLDDGTVIIINNEPLMIDELGDLPELLFNLTFLTPGNTVEVKTYTGSSGLVAVELGRVDP